MEHVRTARLDLRRPSPDDLDDLFALSSDPQVWQHFPSLRQTDPSETAAMIAGWDARWDAHGLGTWVAHARGDGRFVGYGGCSVLRDAVWNLGYRICADEHGQGFATEVARAGVDAARAVRPELPVIAYLVEHNVASAAVAQKLGLELVHRAPDVGNPDPSVIRLVFADRPLTEAELAATLG